MEDVETVTISPKFQVVIPRRIRQKLGLQPGQKVHVFLYDDRLELVPLRKLRKMRGFLRGIDISVPRDPDRT